MTLFCATCKRHVAALSARQLHGPFPLCSHENRRETGRSLSSLQTQWGGYSLVAATRLLMRAALEDPFAQRFQLVCEATIPLRAPLFTHNQLLCMNMSRVGWNGVVSQPLLHDTARPQGFMRIVRSVLET